MDVKKVMNEEVTMKKGNIVAMLATFTETFLMQHTNISQPINTNINNDIMADSISFVLSDDLNECIKNKTDWDE